MTGKKAIWLAFMTALLELIVRAEQAPQVLWAKKGETQWTMNAAAIMGAGSSRDDRLKLLHDAAGGLIQRGGFLGSFKEPDRTYRFQSLYSFLFDRFITEPGDDLLSVSVVFDLEGRVWWREMRPNSCHEQFAQFEAIWGSPTIPNFDKNRQAWGLSSYARSCPNGAWIPVSQYLGWRARLTYSQAYDEKGNALTGFKGIRTVEFKEEMGLDVIPRWSNLGGYRMDRETILRTPGLLQELFLGGVIRLPEMIAKMIIGAARKEAPCGGVERYVIFKEPSRDQEYVGSCHAFASIGLLEAGLRRQHGKDIRLSEIDVLVRARMSDPKFIVDHGAEKGMCRVGLAEGGHPAEDLRLAIKGGVATARGFPYSRADDYQYAKPGREDVCDKDSGSGTCRRPGKIKDQVERLRREAADKALEPERGVTQEALRGFEVVENPYYFSNAVAEAAGMDGQVQLEDMTTLLCRNIPVVVSMDLVGLREWGVGPEDRDARHAFLVSGFRKETGGVVFTTRNSWGLSSAKLPSTNPDLPLKHLSRIYRLTFVMAPKDAGRKPDPDYEPKLSAALDRLVEPHGK